MKERPIIFSSEMVKAILEDRKTQTRRVLKRQSTTNEIPYLRPDELYIHTSNRGVGMGLPFKCPYKVGDRLWVREKYQLSSGDFAPTIEEELTKKPHPLYYASDNPRYRDKDKWKSPIFMPRKYSRITLEITDVRVEGVQDISEEDAFAEGCDCRDTGPLQFSGPIIVYKTNKAKFKNLWNSIHKKEHRWEDNPWVWVISFKRLAQGILDL